jgi:uncharacterized protein (DUF1778 family)
MVMGRPKKKAAERASQLIALRLTAIERKMLERFAKDADLSVSDFIREKLGLRSKP